MRSAVAVLLIVRVSATAADWGRAFTQGNDGLPATDLHALGAGAGVMYAGSPQGCLRRSTGERPGRFEAGTGLSPSWVAVDPAQPDHLVAPGMPSGLVESRDGGSTLGKPWQSRGRGRLGSPEVNRIVAIGGGRAAESEDGGRTRTGIELPAGAMVEVDPNDSQVLYAGFHDGDRVPVCLSRDGGGT